MYTENSGTLRQHVDVVVSDQVSVVFIEQREVDWE